MELSFFTIILTNDCNFNCTYCFQKKDKKIIETKTIEKALNFFFPFLKKQSTVDFYGGEPLLAFDRIQHTVELVMEKNKEDKKCVQFNLTTNGSLITKEILDFFNNHHFGLMLSFDGLVQNSGRQNGSSESLQQKVKDILEYPNIDLEINSVFTPQTTSSITDSIKYLMELGCSEITFNISTMENWETGHLESLKQEMLRLTEYLSKFYKRTRRMPVTNFQSSIPGDRGGLEVNNRRKIFRCFAGQDRMAVTPEGKLWGCYLFHDFFKSRLEHPQYREFCFGELSDFIENFEELYEKKLSNYSELRMDYFKTEQGYCFLCEDIEKCIVCPVNAAYTSGKLGKISSHKCRLIKIQREAQKVFYQTLMKELKE